MMLTDSCPEYVPGSCSSIPSAGWVVEYGRWISIVDAAELATVSASLAISCIDVALPEIVPDIRESIISLRPTYRRRRLSSRGQPCVAWYGMAPNISGLDLRAAVVLMGYPAVLGPDAVSGEVAYLQFHQSAFYQDGAMRKPIVHSILKACEDLSGLLVPWKFWLLLFASPHNKEVVACPELPARPTHLEVRACRGATQCLQRDEDSGSA
jgi:hypothetical protein